MSDGATPSCHDVLAVEKVKRLYLDGGQLMRVSILVKRSEMELDDEIIANLVAEASEMGKGRGKVKE